MMPRERSHRDLGIRHFGAPMIAFQNGGRLLKRPMRSSIDARKSSGWTSRPFEYRTPGRRLKT
jgi:hypothetical protein